MTGTSQRPPLRSAMRARLSIAFLVLLVLAACGDGTKSGTADGTGTQAMDATAVAKELKRAIKKVTEVRTITEDNDPNDLIGRPNGYTSAAVLVDSRIELPCDKKEPSADCGAKVEVWKPAEDAKRRSDYIQTVTKEAGMLGSEYNYLDGAVLLRVAGEIKPSVAKKYEAAFEELD